MTSQEKTENPSAFSDSAVFPDSGNPKKKHRRLLGRHRISLNVTLTLMIILAAVIAVTTMVLVNVFEAQIGTHVFASKSSKTRFVNARYNDLEKYIEQHHVRAHDEEALQGWIDNEKYTEVIIYDKKGEVFSSGWVVDSSGRVSAEGQENGTKFDYSDQSSGDSNQPTVQDNVRIDAEDFHADLYNRVIRFKDGNFYVYINVYNEEGWYRLMDVVSIILAILVFFLMILRYNKRVLNRIIDISVDARRIAGGDLRYPIPVGKNDEIGDLATSVDVMRTSIIEKMDNEKMAMEANTELITSMSHDIRTPLTSLIGYLEIIQDGRYETDEDLARYIHSCGEKAVQLKDLSDKLFQYFLVFGHDQTDWELEEVDAGILFQQLLMEHMSELQDYGYHVEFHYTIPESHMLKVEISGIRRLFDNLFSNIMKYASEDFPVEIRGVVVNGKIRLVFQNHIREIAKKVESTKIGVKTCKKIVEDMNGTFHAMEEEKIYTTEILFDLPPKAEEEAEDSGDSEDPALPKADAGASFEE